MKFFNKFVSLVLVFTIVFLCSGITRVHAQTLGELEQELTDKKNELKENQNKKALTEQEMADIQYNLKVIQNNIAQIQTDTANLESEILELNKQIDKKREEIKNIISYFQISNGESAYLEYVMGAEDFTDFIYRSAVTEQMTSYNNELIDDYTATIKANEEKKEELAQKKAELKEQQSAMKAEYKKLDNQLAVYASDEMVITDAISSLEEMIQVYKDKGCKKNEDISVCGKNVLPATTSFYRQLESGYVTSWYGYRDCSDSRVSCGHNGLDASTGGDNIPVYSIGTGVVAVIPERSSCGGNMVFVHHKLTNGQTYTSVYMHLYQIWVSVGQTVTKDTVIGIMGGGWNTPWDYCSTGAHSHLGLATGLFGIDYGWDYLRSHYIDPTDMINFPNSMYTPWYDRYTAF